MTLPFWTLAAPVNKLGETEVLLGMTDIVGMLLIDVVGAMGVSDDVGASH
jgi:hypothetical protein